MRLMELGIKNTIVAFNEYSSLCWHAAATGSIADGFLLCAGLHSRASRREAAQHLPADALEACLVPGPLHALLCCCCRAPS